MKWLSSTAKKPDRVKPDSENDSRTKYISIFLVLTLIILLLNGLHLGFAWNRYANMISDDATSDRVTDLIKQMIPDIAITICILILWFVFIRIIIQKSNLKILNKRLLYNEALYRSVFSQAPIGIAIVNDERFTSQSEFGEATINPMFEKILGRTSKDLETITWTEITHPDDLQADIEQYQQLKQGKINGYTMEKRFIRPDGSSVWTNMKIAPLMDLPYKHSMHLCLLEDITFRKLTSAALSESERSKSVLFSHLPGLAYRCNNDSEWTMQYVSIGCFDLTGYPVESLLYNRDRSFNSIIAPEYRDVLRKEWARILEKRLPFKYEYEIITANNERKWVLEMGQGIYNDQGEVEALEGIILDISDRKKIENDLRYINEHDSLTGLHNRRVLENLLIGHTKEPIIGKRAVISINLSTVESLTKSYGFHYAQEVIKKAADVLKQLCSDYHLLFNTYWNNFAFYVMGYENKKELLTFCERISNALWPLLRADRLSCGIGIVEMDSHSDHDVDELLKKLLIASEKSMNNPNADFSPCFYGPEIESEILRQEEIKRELARILDDDNDGGLYLQYQPILDLRSNQICGFEALSRLKSDKLGLVSPLEFIPLAEETKLIIPIGQKIIRKALSFLKKLNDMGYKSMSVSINVSVIQLLRNDFVENLFEMIDETQINPQNVGIELTESIFSDDYDEVNGILDKLKDAGIFVAIDDFGTGYSSLARERELNVDCLKIDKHFVDKLMETQPGKALTSDIISMAHKLGHFTIAEGVEDETQLRYLKEWHCDKIQGYLISKPLDEETAIGFISKRN